MNIFLKRLFRFAFIIGFPFLLITLGYFYYDPFKVIYKYNDYSYTHVIPNRDYISTEMYLKNRVKYNYNSFIFGSSRTIGFSPVSWKKYLADTDSPFMFDASGESLYGMYTKLKFLDSNNYKIDNAIVLICRDAAFAYDKNPDGHLFMKHPAVTGQGSKDFQMAFFKAYLTPKFLANFYAYKLIGKYKPFMEGYIEHRSIEFDTVTNQIRIIDQEKEISADAAAYYEKRKDMFYERKEEKHADKDVVKGDFLNMLTEMKQIFAKHNTKYKVIISPLYEQVKFSANDSLALKSLFGDNLYDFSGRNQFTDSKFNYYETSHFRPSVGDSIFRIVYGPAATVK